MTKSKYVLPRIGGFNQLIVLSVMLNGFYGLTWLIKYQLIGKTLPMLADDAFLSFGFGVILLFFILGIYEYIAESWKARRK